MSSSLDLLRFSNCSGKNKHSSQSYGTHKSACEVSTSLTWCMQSIWHLCGLSKAVPSSKDWQTWWQCQWPYKCIMMLVIRTGTAGSALLAPERICSLLISHWALRLFYSADHVRPLIESPTFNFIVLCWKRLSMDLLQPPEPCCHSCERRWTDDHSMVKWPPH